MKVSKFNTTCSEGNTLYVYNSLSGAVIALNPFYSRLFEDSSQWTSDDAFIENMTKGGFLVEGNKDEGALLRKVSESIRASENSLAFTIAPTLACNFRCPYCYEDNQNHNTMSSACVDQTIKYISKRLDETESKALQIAWYGGEPLLCLDIIGRITTALKSKNINYLADIVTNGYFLSEKNAKMLSELDVKHAQVTIDGPPDIHNVRRCLPSGKDTFARILENVHIASKYIHITIRVNVDRENYSRTDELVQYLDQYNLKGKVCLYLAPVANINGSCASDVCLVNKEFSEYEALFLRKHINSGYTYAGLPSFNPGICTAVNKGGEIIDPLGDLYKCWNEVGRKEQSYGSIFNDLRNSNINKWNKYDFEFYAECKECTFLPVCMGGCPHENLIEKRQNCRPLKLNCPDMIILLKDYKAELLKHQQSTEQIQHEINI